MVWGKPVAFDANTIDEYFDLETPMTSQYEDDLPDLDELIVCPCKSGTQWTTKAGTDLKISFPHAALSKYGKAWYAFICARLMPTRHQNDVTKERARLLYGIVHHSIGLRNEVEISGVDVGLCIRNLLSGC